MPPLVLAISAVDHTTGNLTSAAHGLGTGAGPIAVFVGSGGVIPAGLAPVTDCWAIRVDANTVRLASSSANALANVPIAFTTNGTLPLSLLMGVPYRRPRTAAAGTQIFSDDDNSSWDALVALWNLLTGQASALYSSVKLAVMLFANAGITIPTGQSLTLAGTADVIHGTRTLIIPINPPAASGGTTSDLATQTFSAGIPLPAGKRILAVRAWIKDNATGPTKLECRLNSGAAGSTLTTIATSAPSSGAGALQSISASGLTTTIVSGNVYYVVVDANTGVSTCHVYACEVDYDQPV